MTKEEKKKAKEEAKAKKKAEKLAAKQAKKAAKEAKKQGKTVPAQAETPAQQKAAEQAPVENKPVAKAEGKPAAPANGKSGNAAPEDGGELSEKAEGDTVEAQQPEGKAEEDKKQPADGQAKAKPAVKNYHVARRQDGKWQVKFAKGEKAIKLFDTQEEAIAYAKKLAANQDGRITIHKKDGSIRKQKY